jgi:hypothetical protein
MPRFGNVPARDAGDRHWALAVSNRHGEILFVAFSSICAAWVAWEAFF